MSYPLVSVVIPCYNHELFIQESIQSVIDQTYENIELIIIDDGSKDNSVLKILEMIRICQQRFVRFEFRSRPNQGLSSTLNEAASWCQGKYFSALASDDQILEDKTAIQVSFLEDNDDISAVFGGVKLVDNNNLELCKWVTEERLYGFKEIIMHEHVLPAPTQMVRLELIRKIGGYNSNLLIEDWYMWLKLSQNGKIFYLSQIFALYRQHDSNISKNLTKIHQGRLDVLDCFKDHPSYKKAIKKVKWLNVQDKLIVNKNPIYFLILLMINPKKTAIKSIGYCEKRLIKLFGAIVDKG